MISFKESYGTNKDGFVTFKDINVKEMSESNFDEIR